MFYFKSHARICTNCYWNKSHEGRFVTLSGDTRQVEQKVDTILVRFCYIEQHMQKGVETFSKINVEQKVYISNESTRIRVHLSSVLTRL